MSVEHPCTIAAFDVGGTKMAGALVRYSAADAAPTVDALRSVPTEAQRGGSAVLDTLASLVADVVADAEDDVVGIGVGTAGLVDVRTGGIAFANELMPGWTGQPVAERLSASLGLPVAVLNDVKAHALGEARWGAARGAQTCFVIAAGTGLGGGIVANGRVLLGAHGFAGELGRTPCPDALGTPRVCNAGKAWRAALQEGFERQAPSVMHGLPIVDAALGSRAPLIGAAEYLLDTLKGRS